jgi:carboxyl-terminal processing protease
MKKLFASALVAASVLAIPQLAYAAEPEQPAARPKDADTFNQLTLFGDVFELIRNNYVTEPDDKALIEAAINGMLTSLDPHSSYLDPESYSDMQVQTSGEFGGLGIEVTMENGVIKVVSPIDDTPAFKAGIQPGDYITHLDGEPVLGMTLNDAVDRMRGQVGTTIKITVVREGVEQPFDVTLTRDIIHIRSVRSEIRDGNVGYVRVTQFNGQATSGVRDAIIKMQRDAEADGTELVGYILDLRNNPGGLLSEAVGLSDLFLTEGEIVSTRGRRSDSASRYNATPDDVIDGKPLVVLINGGSASASEIVSGALQDHHRAILMGTQSFGKGSVQTVLTLANNGAMRLTTARYYTPSGRSIQARGIDPDIVVRPARVEEIDISGGRHEADLRGALANPEDDGDEDEGAAPAPAPAPAPTPAPAGTADGEEGEGEDAEAAPIDYQLERAVDLLKGVSLFSQQKAQ